jgi:acylphosphatase
MITLHLRIFGRVQGVGFRYYTKVEARRRGVSGWVRNRSDGSVEAMVHGPQGAVDGLVEWARRGPPKAKVDDLQVSESAGTYEDFEMRPTE